MNIICVDDENNALKVLKDTIEICISSNDVLESFNLPSEAIKYASENKIDVAFLDVSMNEMNGFILANKLKEKNRFINIIFCTGYDEYIKDSIDLHASGYVLKPVTPEKIKKAITNLVYPVDMVDNLKNNDSVIVLEAKCYGVFEFLYKGSPLVFKRSKAKELLAVLIDANGDQVDRKYIATRLFPDRELDKKLQSYLSKIIASLEDTFKEIKQEKFLIFDRKFYRVDTKLVTCDVYNGEFDKNKPYMTQYDWEKMINLSTK